MIKKLTSRSAALALALILAASFSMMLWASRTDSAIVDEQAHIPAGYGYVGLLDYRLNPEHPPLIKALAELPVLMFVHPTFPADRAAWTNEVNSEWTVGYDFLYYSGNSANAILFASRIMPIVITLLTALLAYFLARRVMGRLWALVPAFMFALDPTVIAQGHYVTTDVGAAFGVLLAMLFFLRFVDHPRAKDLWLAGIAFGIAQLTKFSTPLLAPFFLFLAVILWLREIIPQWSVTERARRGRLFWRRLGSWIGRTFLVFLIGYAVIVYPAYALFTAREPMATQTSDTVALLGSFAGGAPAGGHCSGMRCIASLDIAMTKNAVTRPIAQYMLGVLMVLQRADGGNRIYFLGEVRNTGGWIYFPAVFLLKEPLPTLIIILLGIILALWWTLRNMRARARSARMAAAPNLRRSRLKAWGGQAMDYLAHHFTEFSLGSFVIFYWSYSMHSPLNIGFRHLMPTVPLIFIIAAGVWRKWIMRVDFGTLGAAVRGVGAAAAKYALLIALLAWLALETLFAGPYFLSYFNEIGGGVWGGYHFVTDSNYDWGQDLLRLQSFVAAHPEINKIAIDYFGGGDPSYYLGTSTVVNWSSSMGNPADHGIHWLAVSANTLELATQPLAPDAPPRNASDTYSWLTALRPPADASGTWFAGSMGNLPTPDYRIGTSIFVYHL